MKFDKTVTKVKFTRNARMIEFEGINKDDLAIVGGGCPSPNDIEKYLGMADIPSTPAIVANVKKMKIGEHYTADLTTTH